MSNKVRLSVDLSAVMNEKLDQLAAETGRTKSEIIRNALELLSVARDAKAAGMHVGAWKDEFEKGYRQERVITGVL